MRETSLERNRRRVRFVVKRAQKKSNIDYRLIVHRSNKHVLAQIVGAEGKVIAVSSTNDKSLGDKRKTANADGAKYVGAEVAKKAVKAGVEQVVFDRSGFKYHGVIAAIADAAREAGLKF